ncbi:MULTISPECIES: Hsp33 family molecular chaperone HslO [Thermoactinomyces]|jgi:molecular chaperone Hsp33|uniref:33 kDa chaperonin n=1 Tax=Thermoactinomyces vulgaris TaxID=2026 RepID=A0ABS0QJF5_THEVU|nr:MULTISPECIES: Hsp33 family molecular chaperone HslO [Thermoactinomyces]KFZ39505.1 heat shock protein Hsp33 [Thermoactinomyces sp. Gus2-1]KYQ85853.1 molecular chaperone Hsp33 [Thermoactinomyces sp. AS95]MBA4552438.1 Hsp33 family molecular chaperone HslO [Thermoactinomyces vulgaris]MBA4596607.1 Hsp33 family molecular chaperone HslO [Thermoactinomyces vulgaris]MBH8584381.1 Hsp33 family molecular chaperone HslO [Thermoactinomyces sp. CICC 10735]
MEDYVIRAISADGAVRGFAARTTNLVQELQQRHRTFPVVSAALGRTATMGAMMGVTLKEKNHKVLIRVEGDGPIGRIMVDADGQGHVRGCVDQPQVEGKSKGNKLDVASAVGKGMIHIIKDLGMKEPYRGASPIISGELAEDFTYYFTASEQTPSSVGLGVLVKGNEILASGGYMIQLLPGAGEEVIQNLEQRISRLSSISDRLKNGETPEEMLRFLMGDDLEILGKSPVQFQCNCSRERSKAMLRALGKEEIESIRDELGRAEVVCHFCNERYLFTDEELERIIIEEID